MADLFTEVLNGVRRQDLIKHMLTRWSKLMALLMEMASEMALLMAGATGRCKTDEFADGGMVMLMAAWWFLV